MKKTLAALLLACSLTACHDPPQIISVPAGGELAKPGQMTVTGQATLEVTPDCADLTITISADDARPGLATRQTETKKLALLAAITKAGASVGDIKLANVQLEPVYEPQGLVKIHAYRAQITITVTTHDFAKLPDLLDAAGSAGATAMAIQFRRSDIDQLKKKVRNMAIAAAKDKAQQTAAALGVKLGPIASVAENPNGMLWQAPYFPNAAARDPSSVTLGGTMQPLTLDVTVGYELARQI